MALIGKNKMGFVDGSIPSPPENDPLYHLWLRNNNIVASWLLNSITQEISASVIQSSIAAALWQDLEVSFRQENGPRLLQLKSNLAAVCKVLLQLLSILQKSRLCGKIWVSTNLHITVIVGESNPFSISSIESMC